MIWQTWPNCLAVTRSGRRIHLVRTLRHYEGGTFFIAHCGARGPFASWSQWPYSAVCHRFVMWRHRRFLEGGEPS